MDDYENYDHYGYCPDGLWIPTWPGWEDWGVGDKVGRGLIIFFVIIYLFFGTAVCVEKLLKSIEMMASKTEVVTVNDLETGKDNSTVTRVFKNTFVNVTLKAIGSAIPVIQLCSYEILANDFQSGDLGPSSVIGSAAFNLFIIIGLSISAFPNKDTRKVKNLGVLLVAAFWTTFAFSWTVSVVGKISYGIVETWEAVLTILLFPFSFVTSFIAERFCCCKSCSVPVGANIISTPLESLTWKEEFNAIFKFPDGCSKIVHIILLPWYLILSFIPPTGMLRGFLTFITTFIVIGLLIILIGDLSGHLACFIGLRDSLNGLIFVGIGVSIHGLKFLKRSANEDVSADSLIVQLIVSSGLNVSLGLGISWLAASSYWEVKGYQFMVPVESFAFSVTTFYWLAILAIIILLIRRPAAGGELGGSNCSKIFSTGIFFLLWIIFVVVCSLETYGLISAGLFSDFYF